MKHQGRLYHNKIVFLNMIYIFCSNQSCPLVSFVCLNFIIITHTHWVTCVVIVGRSSQIDIAISQIEQFIVKHFSHIEITKGSNSVRSDSTQDQGSCCTFCFGTMDTTRRLYTMFFKFLITGMVLFQDWRKFGCTF